MEGRESGAEWVYRQQVPESDVEYQKERAQRRQAFSTNVFGAQAVSSYEKDMEKNRKILADNELELSKLSELDNDPVMLRLLEGNKWSLDEYKQTTLEHVRRNAEFAEEILKNSARLLRQDFKRLTADLRELPVLSQKRPYILEEISYMLKAPKVQDELKKHFGENLPEFPNSDVLVKLSDDSFSDEFLYEASKHYVEKIREQEMMLDKIVGETKEELKVAIAQGVASGWLPEEATKHLSRLDDVVVRLSDRITADPNTLGSMDASGNMMVHSKEIQPNNIPNLKKTITHEFLHELSGKSVTVGTLGTDENKWVRAAHRKSGVRFHADSRAKSASTWLNEAITEWLALRLSGYEGDSQEGAYRGSLNYPSERRELDRLFSGGLEEHTVTDAYFENVSSEQNPSDKGKKFVNLVKRINDIEGPVGFAKLENSHLLREIENQLHGLNITSFADKDRELRGLMPGVEVFDVMVTVGVSQHSAVKKDFLYITFPVNTGNRLIPSSERASDLEKKLTGLGKNYGDRVKFSVVKDINYKSDESDVKIRPGSTKNSFWEIN